MAAEKHSPLSEKRTLWNVFVLHKYQYVEKFSLDIYKLSSFDEISHIVLIVCAPESVSALFLPLNSIIVSLPKNTIIAIRMTVVLLRPVPASVSTPTVALGPEAGNPLSAVGIVTRDVSAHGGEVEVIRSIESPRAAPVIFDYGSNSTNPGPRLDSPAPRSGPSQIPRALFYKSGSFLTVVLYRLKDPRIHLKRDKYKIGNRIRGYKSLRTFASSLSNVLT
ncbi:hypothetical protein EVAR_29383_1 [Eumeta japonica]|uniref:Uncharacterized protein n=1 Tax=Eumeta variegata TaxID=151549 RepID=A0A4C1YEM1_EUMVA|nr:hypothetical protein EVAR_29383_1 [Eumeta japonica]